MEIYLVEEYAVDWDDFPIGSKRLLFATADKERAIKAVGSPWGFSSSSNGSSGISYTVIEVEDC